MTGWPTPVIDRGDEREVTAVWNTYFHCRALRQTRDKTPDSDEPAYKGAQHTGAQVRSFFDADLATLADVTPAQALAANQRLVKLLTGSRWMVMRDAREAGDSWTAIGDALGMSKQGAVDWYRRKIADQEKYLPDFHDTERARAVLGESE
ncbi:hypothetical protein AB0H00_30045 [Nocardia sp. NPDC023852]|uniref:hypothetical protein n=1 Tax=Nocardia sp. NPDC023852 TaxID=3154697 RepID=UPI0033C5BD0C